MSDAFDAGTPANPGPLFMDQAIPSAGLSGTLLVIQALDRREVPRGASMAAIVIDLVSYYAAYTLALGIALAIVWVLGDLMLSTLARTLGVTPGGLGIFEAVSVATLQLIGVPVAAGLSATLLFRFFTFWLPMAPGLFLARREARA